MLKNLRIKSSVRSTPVPYGCRAYTFINFFEHTSITILSDHPESALRYFKDFMIEQGVDYSGGSGWCLNPYVDDFHVVLTSDHLPVR